MIWLSAAMAGGFFYSDSGVIALGRSGAWIAGAEGQFAQYYNPAGLIRTEHPTFNAGFSSMEQQTTWEQRNPDGTYQDPVHNEAAPLTIPQLGFVTPLAKGRFAFAFGLVSPYAASTRYPSSGSQRYVVVESAVYQFSYGPSLAWRAADWLTIGAGLQAKLMYLERSVNVTVTGRDDPLGDLAVAATVADLFTPNANLGILIEPVPAVSIGLAVQPPTRFVATGSVELDVRAGSLAGLVDRPIYQDGDCTIGVDAACASEDGVEVDIVLPWVARGGVAVRPAPPVEIELAVVWQNWKVLQEIVIRKVDPTIRLIGGQEVAVADRFVLPLALHDTISVRLGGHWKLGDDLVVRAGGFYETASVQDQHLSVTLMDSAKTQISGGLSLHPLKGRLRLDASVAGVFFQSRSIRDSAVEQIYLDILNTGGSPSIVGNGDLRARGWLMGLQASWILKRKNAS